VRLLRVFCGVVVAVGLLFLTDPKAAGEFSSARAMMDRGDYEGAKKALEKLIKREPDNGEVRYELGKACFFLKEFGDAAKQFKKIVEAGPDSAKYHLWLARCYGMQAATGSKLKALFRARRVPGEYEKAIELDPANLEARFGLLQFHLMAPGVAGGNKEEARKQVEEIARLDESTGHLAAAALYEADKKYEEAEKELLKAVEAKPEDSDNLLWLGMFYQRRGFYDKALATFEKLLEEHPDKHSALYQIGKTSVLAGKNLDRAEECLKEYLGYRSEWGEPDKAAAHWRLGQVYELQGKLDLAEAEWREGLELDPGSRYLKRSLEKLREKGKRRGAQSE